jgi:uncharacterized LabA/DUF88 family protein
VAPYRVISFVDGFNLYHAIAALDRPELQWVDLRTLSQTFVRPISETLVNVFYFSSYANHINRPVQKAQKTYVDALKLRKVIPIFGHFKQKERICPSCKYKWNSNEEKETDVNIASSLIDLAYQNVFDRAMIISNDSDLVPAIRLIRKRFPQKRITTIAPPHYYHSNSLIKVASDKARIRIEHLEQSLLPPVITDAAKLISITRPYEYSPQFQRINSKEVY